MSFCFLSSGLRILHTAIRKVQRHPRPSSGGAVFAAGGNSFVDCETGAPLRRTEGCSGNF